MSTPLPSAIRWALPACLLLLFPAAAGADPNSWPNVSERVARAVRPALDLAANRVASADCRLVLEDFRDARTGKTLAENLAEKRMSLAEHLGSIHFLDGSSHVRCADPGTLAVVVPGSPIIFVCRAQFDRHLKKDWSFTATVLIHESLHALGLGEDPPTSVEISLQVERRCGR